MPKNLYTPEDDAIIEQYPLSNEEPARLLGRSAHSIANRRSYLKTVKKKVWIPSSPQVDTRTGEKVDWETSVEDAARIQALERQIQERDQTVADLHRALHRHAKIIKTPENTFRFALISDTHFGSLYHDAGALESFLRFVAASGIEDVYHCGDVLEGEKMHFGQDRELSHLGLEQQLDALSDFPHSLGLKVRFITGNHDICYTKASGINVGQMIADRTGWEYLGDMYGRVEYEAPGGTYSLGLMHPRDGSALQVSYKLQKIIDQWSGGEKPNMLSVGHYHKTIAMPQYRNVYGLYPGCFQKQTPFMKGKHLAAHVGGWIIEVAVGAENELWNTVRAEFVSYY